MIAKSWIFDLMLYIYALSLLFTFSDFIERNLRAKRMGTGLLAFVWFVQTILLIYQFIQSGQLINFSIFDSLFLFSWLLISLSLVLALFLRIEFIVFFVSLAGFIVVAIACFSNESISPLAASWGIRDELLFIHVSLAICSYVAFLCSAIFSGMLLFLHAGLKKKLYSDMIRRMPSLDRIQRYSSRAIIIGTPLLVLSLVLGIVWISLEREWMLLVDIKVVSSMLIIIIYMVYIWKQVSAKTAWRKLAMLNLTGFVVVIITYLSSNWLSNFH